MNLRTVFGVAFLVICLNSKVVLATHSPNHAHWAFTDTQSLTVSPLSEALASDVQFDMNGYARSRYGATATAFLASNDAYGWRIRYLFNGQRRTVGINMLDVARWHGERIYGSRMNNWGCYFRNSGPYSWRGRYIFRCLGPYC